MYLKHAHLVQKPAREYVPACDPRSAERAISEAKRKGPLVDGPVVRLEPYGLNHPDHPRWVGRPRPQPAHQQGQ